MSTGRVPDGVTNRKTHHCTPSLNDPAPRHAGSRLSPGPSRTAKSSSPDHSMARTASFPRSNTNDLTHQIPGATEAMQMDARRTQCSETAHRIAAQRSINQVYQTAAASRDGLRSIRQQDAAQGRVTGIGWDIA
jgi:hypothetical protein